MSVSYNMKKISDLFQENLGYTPVDHVSYCLRTTEDLYCLVPHSVGRVVCRRLADAIIGT